MEHGGFIPWEDFKPILHTFTCPCCMGVRLMPTEQELEERITEQIDRERVRENILALEIDTLRKAVQKLDDHNEQG